MKLRNLALIVGALTPALLTYPAHAKSTASASLSNFTLTLIDLTPEDGIAPGLQVLPNTDAYSTPPRLNVGYARVWHTYAGAPQGFQFHDEKTSIWDTARAEKVASNGTATLASGSAISGTSLETLFMAAKASVSSSAVAGNLAESATGSFLKFVLSPNTGLSLTWDANVEVDHPSAKTPGTAMASVSVYFTGPGNSRSSFGVAQSLGRNSLFPSVGNEGLTSFSHYLGGGTLGATFNMYATASADVRSGVSPIPEPQTWGMLIAGLGMIGAAGWRARAKRA